MIKDITHNRGEKNQIDMKAKWTSAEHGETRLTHGVYVSLTSMEMKVVHLPYSSNKDIFLGHIPNTLHHAKPSSGSKLVANDSMSPHRFQQDLFWSVTEPLLKFLMVCTYLQRHIRMLPVISDCAQLELPEKRMVHTSWVVPDATDLPCGRIWGPFGSAWSCGKPDPGCHCWPIA